MSGDTEDSDPDWCYASPRTLLGSLQRGLGRGAPLGVLEVLGRAGVGEVVAEVRRYIRSGERWLEALETVARSWPIRWWDDLYPVGAGRLNSTTPDQILWRSAPWTAWTERSSRIATAVDAAKRRPAPTRPYADTTTRALLDLLRDTGRVTDWRPALRELRRRPPEPALLEIVDTLVAADVGHPLAAAMGQLGTVALPAARTWATTPRHPLFWTGVRLLAAHGGQADVPALVAGLDCLDSRPPTGAGTTTW
ncbi:hypothetical protein [Micromonospora sp. NPDC051006]|uniref:hypothetical protein n=1 Tax=Micromonospora sp. NPDC051006 TaxID=3364283 RepID=UPI003793864B